MKNNPNTKFIVLIVVMSLLIIGIVISFIWSYIGKDDDYSLDESIDTESETIPTSENFLQLIDRSGSRLIEVEMTDGQKFKMEIYPKVAPKTCENFLNLVNSGFYDGLTFHRIEEGFMAQGGAKDPKNQQNDGLEPIEGEFEANGFKNKLSHQRGVVSMARTNDYNSATSQFFICYGDESSLDGQYASFGYVTEGMETVDSFLSEGTNPQTSEPLKEVKIKTMRVVK